MPCLQCWWSNAVLDNVTSVCQCVKPTHHTAAPPPRAACAASPLLLTPRSCCNAGHRTNSSLTPLQDDGRILREVQPAVGAGSPSAFLLRPLCFSCLWKGTNKPKNHTCSQEEETPSNSSGLPPRFHFLLTSPKQCSLAKIRGKNDAVRKEMFQHLLWVTPATRNTSDLLQPPTQAFRWAPSYS